MLTLESSGRDLLRSPRASGSDRRPLPSRPELVGPRVRWYRIAIASLLALYAVMSWTASLSKGVSFDEGLQLAAGYNIWLNDDFRIEGANGDFIKRWATLPYLISRPNFLSRSDPLWQQPDSYAWGHRFLFQLENRPEELLWQARAMAALLGVMTGALVFWCSRELFGRSGALVSLATFTFSPNMLAFGGVVSTDMSIILSLLGSTICIWRLLHEVNCRRLIASLGFFAVLLLAKMTAVLIFPIAGVLLTVRLIAGGDLVLRWRGHVARAVGKWKLITIAGLIALHALAGWTAIWAHYGFRFAADPERPAGAQVDSPAVYRDGDPGPFATVVEWARRARMLPESYCRGVEWLLGDDNKLPAYMAGEAKLGGWSSFFPYAIWVKTRPALFLLLGLGAYGAWCMRRGGSPRALGYAAVPYFTLITIYMIVALTKDINIGHRHVLPIYPALYVLVGAATLAWGPGRRWVRALTLVVLIWGVADSINARPHYLAYFGAQAGGAASGHEHLVDSSLDWGMNLPGLKRWLDANTDIHEPVFLAYFGTDDPEYHGIRAKRLPGFFDWRKQPPYALTPGYYAISATLFRGVYVVAFGQWNPVYEKAYWAKRRYVEIFEQTAADPAARAELLRQKPAEFWESQYRFYDHLRFARLCAWLRHQGEPPNHVGHALFIWKLDAEALQAALLGPPVEMGEVPPEWRRLVGMAP